VASGRTPWEVLHDPHLGFNVSVMRAALRARDVIFGMAMQGAPAQDEFGVGRVLLSLALLYKDRA